MSPGSARRQRREAEARGIPKVRRLRLVESPPRDPMPGDEFAWGDPRRDSLDTWLPLLLLLPKWDPRWQSAGFRFEGRLARRAIGWIERHVRHLNGPKRGQLVRLDPWQRSLLANLFGWVYDSAGDPDDARRALDGRRRFRKALLYIAKKNGKSTLVGALAAYAFTRLKEGGAKVLTAATHKGQARTVWEVARDVIEADRRTKALCILWNASVQLVRDRTAILEPISGEAKGEDGADCSFAILDELHRQKDLRLLTILEQGGGARSEPVFLMLTTADEIRDGSPCNEERAAALRIRANHGDPNAPGWNPSYLPAVYELDEGDDWADESVWHKANPGLGTIKSLESMRALYRDAKDRDDARVEFQRFQLNLRVQPIVAPIRAESWARCRGPRSWLELREALRRRPCILGADLAETNDMVGLVAWFYEDLVAVPWFWTCGAAAEFHAAKGESVYYRWRDAGALSIVEGNAIELAPVVAQVLECGKSYDVKRIGIDRAKALEFSFAVESAGIQAMFVGQGWVTMTEPCDWLRDSVETGKIVHGGHPILTWNMENLRFRVTGERAKKPEKASRDQKIDGAAALLTARAAQLLLQKDTVRTVTPSVTFVPLGRVTSDDGDFSED